MTFKSCKSPGPNCGNILSCYCLSDESKIAYLYQFKWGYEYKIINECYVEIHSTEWDDVCKEFFDAVLNYCKQQKTKYEQYESNLLEFIKEN